MAEASYLWDNPGIGDSPALGYGNALWNQVIFRMLANGTGDQGVLRNWLNELEVMDGGVDTATVDTGGAMLYGVWYESDAAVDVDINAYRGGNCLFVVRASWATQTARIVARAVGALTQTAGVTYEIPLANVAINGAGAITLITDIRDFCEFSTDLWPFSVEADHIQADAATIAKMIDQDRWLDLGHGCMVEDVAAPATWASHLAVHPFTDGLDFAAGALNEVWVAFLVPADFGGTNVTITLRDSAVVSGTGDVRWLYNAEIATAAGAFANANGNALQTLTLGTDAWNYAWLEFTLGTLAVNAGDLVLLRISRDGAHGSDTSPDVVTLFQVTIDYTADS